MAAPLICIPQWWDRVALHGAVTTPVHMTRGAALPALRDPRPTLVAGTTRTPTADGQPGELIVTGDFDTAGGPTASAAAPLLLTALRRLRLPAHLGSLGTAHPATAVVDAQTVALHAVAATSAVTMQGAGTAWPLVTALRALRSAAPAIDQWAAATGDRDILLASPRSFCAGVERAVLIVERAMQRFGTPVYVRRQIVHNRHVVQRLQNLGAVFVEELDEVPAGATVVLAAHGVSPTVRHEAEARGLRVIDATCPLVAKVHNEVRRYAASDHTIFLIGHDDHEEVIGTRGEAPDNVVVVADPTQAAEVEPRDRRKVAYVMQTTLAADEAQRTVRVLADRFPGIIGPRQNDICYATTNRQAAVVEIARQCDLVLVIGSANSSNSHRLVEVAKKQGAPAYLVDDVGGVELGWLAGVHRVGITAGASAPPHLVDQLVSALSGLGRITVHTTSVVDEDVQFTLPHEVS